MQAMIPHQQFCRTCPIDRSMSIDLNNWGRSIFSDPCHPCFRNKFSEIVSAAATCQTRLSSAVSSRTTSDYVTAASHSSDAGEFVHKHDRLSPLKCKRLEFPQVM